MLGLDEHELPAGERERRRRVAELEHIAFDRTLPEKERMRAIELLGRMAGDFEPQSLALRQACQTIYAVLREHLPEERWREVSWILAHGRPIPRSGGGDG